MYVHTYVISQTELRDTKQSQLRAAIACDWGVYVESRISRLKKSRGVYIFDTSTHQLLLIMTCLLNCSPGYTSNKMAFWAYIIQCWSQWVSALGWEEAVDSCVDWVFLELCAVWIENAKSRLNSEHKNHFAPAWGPPPLSVASWLQPVRIAQFTCATVGASKHQRRGRFRLL